MKKMFTTLFASTLLVGVMALPAVADDDASVASVASSSNQFDILVDLVVSAGLADALSATGDADTLGAITVFAPTDNAFRKLVYELQRKDGVSWYKAFRTAFRSSEAAIADTVRGAVGGDLATVLLYHVSNEAGAVPFAAAKTLKDFDLPMLGGGNVEIDGIRNRFVRITDNNDRRTYVYRSLSDISAGDDIIHGINRVLLP